jgi:multiple sugar transport system substrate-binding protein
MRGRLPGVVLLVAVLASACSASTATSSPPASAAAATAAATAAPTAAPTVNLVLRYCWGGEEEVRAMESVIKAWNDANPTIQVRGVSGDVKTDEIAAAVAGGNPPDMAIMCDNSAIAGFAHDGVIMNMDDLLTQIGADKSDIIPASLDWVSYQGKLYGLPFGEDAWALYWNKDEFAKAGLDPEKPPTTPDELWADAKALTKLNADGSIAQLGFVPNDPEKNPSDTSNLFGCQLFDAASNKVTVNSPACVAWFDWYKSWYTEYNKNGALTNFVASRGPAAGGGGALYDGRLAMGIFGEWITGKAYAQKLAPNLNYGTAPIPAISSDLYGAGFVNGNAFFIPKGSRDPVAAAKFGMYLMTDDPSRAMAVQNASVPQLKSLLTDPALATPHFQTFLNIANHPKTWTTPMISQWGEYSDGLSSALDSVLTGGVDSKTALDDLASKIQADLDANGP